MWGQPPSAVRRAQLDSSPAAASCTHPKPEAPKPLPPPPHLCYKPDMRKWMRERLQRKKKPAEPTDQPAPPPLQPAYFDAEQPPAKEKEIRESEPSPAHAPELDSQPESRPRPRARVARPRPADVPSVNAPSADAASPDTPAPETRYQVPHAVDPPAPGESAQRTRGRRRRGGRGRSGGAGRGRQQAVAQALTPAAVKGVAPDVPVPALSVPSLSIEEQPADLAEPDAAPAPARPAPSVPPAAAAVPQRAPKGIVVLAIGLPGSGKSSWFKRHNVVALSSDMVRSLLFDDVREQRFQDLVFSNLRSMLKARLIAKRPMNYVDATNLTPQERQHWVKLAKDYNYEVHAVFFDVPLEVCLERHQRRDRVVPEDVMRRMAAKLKAPTFEEGFAKITVVRVKKKEDIPSSEQSKI
jgi:predicted kinase